MSTFSRRPVLIEAFRWTADIHQTEDPLWIIQAIEAGIVAIEFAGTPECRMRINTRGTVIYADRGDWITRSEEGEISYCPAENFDELFEDAHEASARIAALSEEVAKDRDSFREQLLAASNDRDNAQLYFIAAGKILDKIREVLGIASDDPGLVEAVQRAVKEAADQKARAEELKTNCERLEGIAQNWAGDAQREANNASFYRGLLIEAGKATGSSSIYVADDGGVSEVPLALKIVPAVVALKAERDRLKAMGAIVVDNVYVDDKPIAEYAGERSGETFNAAEVDALLEEAAADESPVEPVNLDELRTRLLDQDKQP